MDLRVYIILVTASVVYCQPCRISLNGTMADCSHRGLGEIPSLSNYTQLLYLDLSGNRITVVRNSSFTHLLKLQTLNLNCNRVRHIDELAFTVLKDLKYLSLSHNNISILSSRFGKLRFYYNPNLTFLDLSFNTYYSKDREQVYQDKVFASLSNLTELHINLLTNPVFGEGFQLMTKIEKIIFKDCEIMHLKNDTFINFHNITSLTHLEMTNCRVYLNYLDKIEIAFLQHFRSLQHLDISGTSITLPVAMEILYGLTVTTNHSHPVRHMTLLNLYNVNPLELLWTCHVDYTIKVTQEMTKYYRKLCAEKINIGKNGIVEVEPGSLETFDDYTCLERYHMAENNFIMTFPKFMVSISRLLTHSINLIEIDFSYMAIQFPNVKTIDDHVHNKKSVNVAEMTYPRAPRCVLPMNKTSIRFLRLSHLLFPARIDCDLDLSKVHELTLLDMSYTTVTSMNFRLTGITIQQLDVSGIDFSTSGGMFLGSLKGVQELVIRDANLDRAFSNENYIFKDIHNIEVLNMSSNHLNSLSCESLQGLESLHTINLTWNFLKALPEGLYNMPNLTHIDMRSNTLIFLNEESRQWLDHVNLTHPEEITVLMEGNPFICSCDTAEFISWVFTTHVHLDKDTYMCILKNGSNSNMSYINDHHQTVFGNCNDELFWLQFSISGLSLLILALVLATLGHTFRWRILYYFYRNCKLKPELQDTASYDFDLFVAYTAADSPWIWQHLRPKLEVENRLTLCLHERDFEVGESISQNIVNFVQKSKKILFIISAEYIAARWCEFELEMANMERVQRGCTSTIIVAIKGDISPDEMPRTIRNIWQQVTCIIYPLDETDNGAFDLFWCRLRQSVVV